MIAAKGYTKGQAKVEFIACKAEIEKLFKEGHSKAEVHRMLVRQGKITIGNKNFYRLVKKFGLDIIRIERLKEHSGRSSRLPDFIKNEVQQALDKGKEKMSGIASFCDHSLNLVLPKAQPPTPSSAPVGSVKTDDGAINMKRARTNRYSKDE